MKVTGIPPAGPVITICLALISPALAVVDSIIVKAGVVIGSDASSIGQVTAPALSVTTADAPSQHERSVDTPPQRTAETTDRTPTPDDTPIRDGTPIGYRLARAPGDSPFLFFFITVAGAVTRKTRFPSALRWPK